MNWQHRVTGLRSSDLQRQYNDVVCTARERFKRNGKRCSLISCLFLIFQVTDSLNSDLQESCVLTCTARES